MSYNLNMQGDSFLQSPRNNVEERETVLFVNFLSDYDPSLIFLVTYCAERNVSYLKVLKVKN